MFKVGDKIIGLKSASVPYSHTKEGYIGTIEKITRDGLWIDVRGANNIRYSVCSKHFKLYKEHNEKKGDNMGILLTKTSIAKLKGVPSALVRLADYYIDPDENSDLVETLENNLSSNNDDIMNAIENDQPIRFNAEKRDSTLERLNSAREHTANGAKIKARNILEQIRTLLNSKLIKSVHIYDDNMEIVTKDIFFREIYPFGPYTIMLDAGSNHMLIFNPFIDGGEHFMHVNTDGEPCIGSFSKMSDFVTEMDLESLIPQIIMFLQINYDPGDSYVNLRDFWHDLRETDGHRKYIRSLKRKLPKKRLRSMILDKDIPEGDD